MSPGAAHLGGFADLVTMGYTSMTDGPEAASPFDLPVVG